MGKITPSRPTCSAHFLGKILSSKEPVVTQLSNVPFPAAAGVQTGHESTLCSRTSLHRPVWKTLKSCSRIQEQLHAYLGHTS